MGCADRREGVDGGGGDLHPLEVVRAGYAGGAALDGLLTAADRHPEPAVRAAALGARARAGRLDDAHLVAGLGDPDAGVRRRAVELAARRSPADWGGPVDRVLIGWLAVGGAVDATLVEVAAWALGERFGDRSGEGARDAAVDTGVDVDEGGGDGPAERAAVVDEVVAALGRTATGHADALCREAAVAALGAIGRPAGLAAILAATTDKATVRRRAVLALAPYDGPEVAAALERARQDRDWQVRQAAELLSDDPDPGAGPLTVRCP